MDAQALAKKVVDGMLAKDEFSRWLGVEVLELRPGYAKVKMKVRKEMLNGFHVAHGGITFSLADSALAFASNSHGRVSMSIENGMAYTTKVLEGDVLTAETSEEHLGKTISVYSIRVSRADGAKVGVFRGTVFRTDREHQV